MKIILLILAIIWSFGYAMNHIKLNIKYNTLMRGGKFQQITGSILAAISNGIAWWYIIDCIVKW